MGIGGLYRILGSLRISGVLFAMTESLSDILLRTAKSAETPYRKKFALERLELVKRNLRSAQDDFGYHVETEGWIADIDYAIQQIKGIQE